MELFEKQGPMAVDDHPYHKPYPEQGRRPRYQEIPPRPFKDIPSPEGVSFDHFNDIAAEVRFWYGKLFTWLQNPYIVDDFAGHELRSRFRRSVDRQELELGDKEHEELTRSMRSTNKVTNSSLSALSIYLQNLRDLLSDNNSHQKSFNAFERAAGDFLGHIKQAVREQNKQKRVERIQALEDLVAKILREIARLDMPSANQRAA